MGTNLGRLAVTFARGVSGLRKAAARQGQQDFENQRQLADEEDSRAYHRELVANQRAQNESLNQQRMALQMEKQRAEAEKAQVRSRRVSALGRKGIYEPAIADDDVAFRQAMRPPGPRNIDRLSEEGIQAQTALERLRGQLPPRARRTASTSPLGSVDDVPVFLRPATIARRAATLTKARPGAYGIMAKGLEPAAAADSAQAETVPMREAAYRADMNALTAILHKAQSRYRNSPRDLREMQKGYEEHAVYLRQKYGIPEER